MKPTNKSPEINEFLESLFGRSTAIKRNRCIPQPIGCGNMVGEFRDELSRTEYRISGLCQNCQDKIFGGE